MERIFIPVYRFFCRHKALMYTLLIASTVIFAVFGFQLYYEEDISKLLPQTEKASQSGFVFGNLRVKDKIFIQLSSRSGEMSPEDLEAAVDTYVESLFAADSTSGYIANCLYSLDDGLMLNALDFGLGAFPAYVTEESYAGFDSLLTPSALDAQMARNKEIIFNDFEGNKTMLVSYDPASLRTAMLPQGKALMNGMGGFKVIDNHFFSPDSTVVLAFLAPNFKSFDSKSGTKLIRLIESAADSFQAENPDVEVLFHGSPVNSVCNSRQIKKDLVLSMSISLLLICLVIGLCFRNRNSLILLLMPVAYGALFALACVFWIKGSMSLMAIGIGAVILGVAMSYCLHVLTHYKYAGDPEQVIREQSTPVSLGCLTTIGAFVGLLFTESDLLKDFGLFASFALVGTTIFALVFLPHFFTPENNRRNEKAFGFIDRINSYPLDRKYWLVGIIAAICIVTFFTSRKVGFDSDLRNIGFVEPPVRKSQIQYAEKVNGGQSSLYFAASSPELDSALVANKAILSTLEDLYNQGQITKYGKVTSMLLPLSEQQANIDAWKAYWSPEKIAQTRRDIAAAAKKNGLSPDMFEPFFLLAEADYEPQSVYDSGIVPEELMSNFIEESDDNYLVFTSVVLPEENRKVVSDAVCANPHSLVVDPMYYTSDMVEVIHRDFNVVLWISSLFVLLVLLVSFRSITTSLIAFLPMFLSWYVVQGVMAIFGIEFNLINIVISTFIFGIGVDYSIFVTDGMLSQARGNGANLLVWHKAAITFSAFVLIVVVCSLLITKHPAVRSVGVSTIIGMSSTILITYTLQTLLLRLALGNKTLRRFMLHEKNK